MLQLQLLLHRVPQLALLLLLLPLLLLLLPLLLDLAAKSPLLQAIRRRPWGDYD